jgi:SAM-dependent methyltransferase
MRNMTYRNDPRRTNRDATSESKQVTVPLPEAPITASPVPWLTSIHATPGRGNYGKADYRGNCSGLLIRDLLSFYRPGRVLDPAEGGGTCRDVCRELGIEYEGRDLRRGFDATDAASFARLGTFDFIWFHPPYWQMVRYNAGEPRCLSNAPTLDLFLEQMKRVFRNCRGALRPGGKLAVLMGDCRQQGRYLGLPFLTLNAAAEVGFWLAAPEIIRFSHGATSSRQRYTTAFIPRLHDVCLVLERVRTDANERSA